jgi:hypothetical protein
MSHYAREAIAVMQQIAGEDADAFNAIRIHFYAEVVALIAVEDHIPKFRLLDLVGDYYDTERNNARAPQ